MWRGSTQVRDSAEVQNRGISGPTTRTCPVTWHQVRKIIIPKIEVLQALVAKQRTWNGIFHHLSLSLSI